MKIEKIKPIPKYILKLIKKKDLECCKEQHHFTRYYSYLTKNDGELVQVIVAVKNRYTEWLCKQVVVHSMHSEECFIKDIAFFTIAGYVTNWYAEGYGSPVWYADGKWDLAYDRYFHLWSPCVNKEYVEKFPKLKYCAYKEYKYGDFFKYLKVYERFPEAEYLVKMGLSKYAMSVQLLRQCRKDKAFRKWLFQNRTNINLIGYYISAILLAYKKGWTLEKAQRFESNKKALCCEDDCKELRAMIKPIGDYEKFFNYLKEQGINTRDYNDYLKACSYLKLDMTLSKNRYPHDFKQWHDIRTEEYASAKAKADAEERKEFYAQFKNIAKKYESLQEKCKGSFICIIAKSPAELAKEGSTLHHCVGKMGYDKKFVDEKTLIFFVRDKEHPKTPLVTIEYSLSKHQVIQIRGEHNSTPSQEILNYINATWLPYANKQLKKVLKAA